MSGAATAGPESPTPGRWVTKPTAHMSEAVMNPHAKMGARIERCSVVVACASVMG